MPSASTLLSVGGFLLLPEDELWSFGLALGEQAVRINPFDHAPDELPADPPSNVGTYWIWAFPVAEAWVRDGGTVWPWNA